LASICVTQVDHGINSAGGFPAVFFLCRESCLLLRHIFIIFLGATAFFWSLLINKKKNIIMQEFKELCRNILKKKKEFRKICRIM